MKVFFAIVLYFLAAACFVATQQTPEKMLGVAGTFFFIAALITFLSWALGVDY